jgi:hypothetical protein
VGDSFTLTDTLPDDAVTFTHASSLTRSDTAVVAAPFGQVIHVATPFLTAGSLSVVYWTTADAPLAGVTVTMEPAGTKNGCEMVLDATLIVVIIGPQ